MKLSLPLKAPCSQCSATNSQEICYEEMTPNLWGLILILIALAMYGLFGFFAILILCLGTLLFRKRHLVLKCSKCQKVQTLCQIDEHKLHIFIKHNKHRFVHINFDDELAKLDLSCLKLDDFINDQWNCNICDEQNPGHFYVCWNCCNPRTEHTGHTGIGEQYQSAPKIMLSNGLSPNEIRFDKNHTK